LDPADPALPEPSPIVLLPEPKPHQLWNGYTTGMARDMSYNLSFNPYQSMTKDESSSPEEDLAFLDPATAQAWIEHYDQQYYMFQR
jgi:hypothetical protein